MATKYVNYRTKSVTKSTWAGIYSYIFSDIFISLSFLLLSGLCFVCFLCLSCLSTSLLCIFKKDMFTVCRYLLWILPSTYSPLDYRTFIQTQFMSLKYAAKMLKMASTGASGVPTQPREHQRIVSFMTPFLDYFE